MRVPTKILTNTEDRKRLQGQSLALGVNFEYIESMLNNSTVDEMGGESWDEIDLGAPGDVNKTPCVVHCYNNSNQPGSVTRRNYVYIV